tara:strand:- start:2408 stop:2938 length:531 start_codon:yes stop_codon:yes gene_type:complete
MKLKKYFLKVTKSTNDVAIRKIKEGKERGIIITEKQTNGRGQRGNKWISLKGNLFMSIFFEVKNIQSIKKITKENCKIIKQALSKFVQQKIQIKKPNDLLIKKKKICGILQETLQNNDKFFFIVGIGLNLVKSPKISNYPTTYLFKYTNKNVSKSLVFRSIKNLYEKKIKYLKLNN